MTFSSITELAKRRKQRQLQFVETLLCGIVGGILFTLLHLPLSWMLGPLTAILIWKLTIKTKFILAG